MAIISSVLLLLVVSCSIGVTKPGTGGTSSAKKIEKTDHPTFPDGVSCYVCHKADIPVREFHKEYGNRCDECHGTATWMAEKYPHTEWHLDEIHRVRCTRCHTKASQYDFSYYQCYGCHHDEENIKTTHSGLNVKNLSQCVTCHKSSAETGRTLSN